MTFDQRQLRAFLAVVDRGSLGRAADVACMTQPALSRLIGEMERRFGQRLFDRHSKGMVPTAAGETLIPHARLLLFEMEQAASALDALRGLGRGRLRVGAVAAIARTILPAIAARLLDAAPKLQVDVLDAPEDRLVQALTGREIDVVIAPAIAPHPEIRPIAELDYKDSYTVLAAAAHPLAHRADVGLDDVLGERWAMPEIGSAPRMLFHNLVTAQGGALPDVAVETNSIGVMLATVSSSRLLGWLPKPLIGAEMERGLIAAIGIPVLEVERRFFVYTRRKGSLIAAAHRLFDLLPLSSRAVAAPSCGLP
ncbi:MULTISPECIES: LysR family transcriptional regulator [unclassified Sphingomonas]|uniref:LysR family transcriptional regulator n=1 Tax=unclassified Sphingomonas TaxID=196159 RepID=UPI0009278C2D|nr:MULTISPECIES: LysR family transcriptional regulator [unclassified Sphingomonas]OJU18009.1 MAG: hypothetical protein BGN95_17460 [Sphingomonas sp. 66-10]